MAFSHDISVHKAITMNAAKSAFVGSTSYTAFINAVTADCSLHDATNSMVFGSDMEDNRPVPIDAGGYRSINHFYDPLDNTYGKGLSDFPPDIRYHSTGAYGTNSFRWLSF
jgi:hypothetical protein